MPRSSLYLVLVSALTIIALSTGCRHDPFHVNLSGIECEIDIKDLGRDIFETPPPHLGSMADSLRESCGQAIETYSAVIGLGDPADEKWKSAFILFATDLQNLELYDEVKKVWPSLDPLERGLEAAFRHYLYYFPEAAVPEVIACVSAFNNSIIIDDSLLMVGLDRYMGADSKYYPALGINEYQSRRMTPAYTVSDCMYAWASTEWDYRDMGYGTKTLLSSMLHEAKLLYFTRCMMPSLPDTILFGFTRMQLEYCRSSEGRFWDYFVSHDLLFSTDSFLIRKFTGEAPYTSYFTEESPGRAAVWTGYRIVERYMKNNREISLAELMTLTDCQQILAGARYSP